MAAAVPSTRGEAARVVLTGPSGWIGQAMLARLAREGGAPAVTAFASSARAQSWGDGAALAVRPLETIAAEDVADAHVIHLAYLTKEKAEQLGERRFTDTNLAIDDAVLNAIEQGRPRSIFVASSGAAALAAAGRDLHPYGMAKLRQEARFLDAGARLGVPVLAGRIFNIAGPYINKLESYAISNFAVQARETGRIRIAATVPVYRSYLHVDDLCALVLAAAHGGIGRDRAIDLCGSEVVEMEDLAAAVADTVGGAIAIERDRVDYGRASVYLGGFPDTRTLAMEGGVTLSSLAQQVSDTDEWIGRRLTTPRTRVA